MRSTRQIQLTASRRLMSCLHRVNLRRFRLRKAKRVVVHVPKTAGTFLKLNLLAKDKTSLHWGHSSVLGWFPVLNHFSNAHRSACIRGPYFTFLGKSPLTASTTPAFSTTSVGLPSTQLSTVSRASERTADAFSAAVTLTRHRYERRTIIVRPSPKVHSD